MRIFVAVAAAVSLGVGFAVGGGAAWASPVGAASAQGDPGAQPLGFRVRVRYLTLEPTDTIAKLDKLIARSNRKAHRDAFADGLNSGVLDPAKAAAFLGALRSLPAETRAALGRGVILLDDAALGLSVASPYGPSDLSALGGFDKLEVDGPYLVLAPNLRVDAARARAQIRATRARLAELDALIDQAGDTPRAWALKRDRFVLAGTWRACARALADHGADAGTRAGGAAELARAEQRISQIVVNIGGMPDDDDLAPL